MSRVAVEVCPGRITEARQARAYNISQLAELVGVTRQSMSKYELGLSSPSEKVVNGLSEKLGFPFDFFYKPLSSSGLQDSTVFYRSLKSSEANIRAMIKVKCDWTNEVYSYLDYYLSLPSLNLPALDLILAKKHLSSQDIENMADTVRKYWGLGEAPIDNLVYVMEKNGFIISSSIIDSEKADACSEMLNGRPIVFLGKGSKSACRTRFSLAHELGHIIMHGYITKEDLKDQVVLKKIEAEANRFASAFLLPKRSFINDVRSLSLDYFVMLKRKWKVSIAAMIYRCQDLNIFDDNQVLALRKQISYKKWNREEPLDKELPLEIPKLLKTAIEILFNKNVVSRPEFINHFKWGIDDLADICGCGQNVFRPSNTINIPLKLV